MDLSVHIPVLRGEVVSLIGADRGGRFLDCTVGGGGHAEALLEADPLCEVLGCDRDERAITRAKERLSHFGERIELVQGAFSDLERICQGRKFDGILADLGLSSDQLAEERGFSFNDKSPLDMRMDQSQPLTAEQIVNDSSERELFVILKEGGVGPEARRVVKEILSRRPIADTAELASAVMNACGRELAVKKRNPATVVFQAIRIAVNRELEQVKDLLDLVPAHINPAGRLVVISFHSLEDKLVASRLRKWSRVDTGPALRPVQPESPRLGELLTPKAVVPSESEQEQNPRSRSARLRAFKFEEN